MLGLPNLVLSIFFFVLIIQAVGLDKISDLPANMIFSSPLFSTFILTTLLFIVVLIVCTVIMMGIQLSVIRETIMGKDILPNLDPGKNFVDGLKVTVLSIVYIAVPVIIYMLIVFGLLYLLKDNAFIGVILITAVLLIVSILLSIVLVVALGRLAETDSLQKTLEFGTVYEMTKVIGFGKIFLIIVFSILLNLVISIIGSVLGLIPIIGFFISTYVLYSYNFLVMSRCYGLLYRDNFGARNDYPNNAIVQSNSDLKVGNNDETLSDEELVREKIDNGKLDYQPDNDSKDTSVNEIKKCSNCGFSNPYYVNYCSNCGNKL
ncbi:DUF4013 domain-containing protein [Methanosphaera sp. ISO3-F5]|uniref:DUF4013 domain-containing protein n=1 Tax=Methanosphaera sp. ISO3-F5 TaxID=1452353 RepID=UPI002B263034|nr:DUF4013 domain-containing protein [Methanosphaera sp. ISO3-F5]WQH63999.1 DUF4013 domain-containing protein [Methanosphaera sp. ISO3-F5]